MHALSTHVGQGNVDVPVFVPTDRLHTPQLYFTALLIAISPGLIFTLFAWGWESAAPFNGVCTYVGANLPTGFSVWQFVQELLGFSTFVV